MKQQIPVKIVIRSLVKEVVGDKEEKDAQSYLFHCRGTMTCDDKQISVSYKEDPKTDMGNTKTTLLFPRNNPDLFMMAREGDISCTMSFSCKNPRHFCSYRTPFAPFSFVINTKKLHCEMSERGGRVSVDYGMELRGLYVEFHRLSILITPEKEQADEQTDSDRL